MIEQLDGAKIRAHNKLEEYEEMHTKIRLEMAELQGDFKHLKEGTARFKLIADRQKEIEQRLDAVENELKW